MAIPLNHDFDGLADFRRIQSIGIVVDVCDLLSGELYNNVTGPEAAAVGWAIAANSGKFYS